MPAPSSLTIGLESGNRYFLRRSEIRSTVAPNSSWAIRAGHLQRVDLDSEKGRSHLFKLQWLFTSAMNEQRVDIACLITRQTLELRPMAELE